MRNRVFLATCTLALALLPPVLATGAQIADIRLEQLAFLEDEIRLSLTLTPNQLTLWRATVVRTKDLMRARQSRRTAMQAEVKTRVQGGDELRAVAALLDAENAVSMQEEQQLRVWWLNVDDALDDRQRALVRRVLLDELDRVIEARPERGAGSGRGDGQPGGRPEGGGRGGQPRRGGGPG
ncbi:MAG TPA: hypothetical protein VIT92_03170 [Burkholderiaceae bacterium]